MTSIFSNNERYGTSSPTHLVEKLANKSEYLSPASKDTLYSTTLITPTENTMISTISADDLMALVDAQKEYKESYALYLNTPTNMDSNLALTLAREEYTLCRNRWEDLCVEAITKMLESVK